VTATQDPTDRSFHQGETVTHRTRRRIGTVALAPATALVTWAFIRLIGVDLVVSAGRGTVGAGDVVVAALLGALAGWFVVRLLERRTRRPRLWWAIVGSTALAVSIIGPAWLADGASAVALITLHIATAVVVINGFARTLPAYRFAVIRRARQRPGGDPA
jgi:Family of unknown function (DUF6069)